ncbi:hypothetical protein HK100_007284 [Physocladia obscura]|uniref:Uncharacterized protein n=1 Tax=Physocladia obscura TaxID=109957 RepID=A0AAD5SRU1_9FUNG|nr:hypothetical protein HK100_007284 [Physocladia obscura]
MNSATPKPSSAGGARRAAVPPPSASFSFSLSDRANIAKWLNESAAFFASKGATAHENLNLAFTQPHVNNTMTSGNIIKYDHGVLSGTSEAELSNIPRLVTQDDVLEDRTVHEMVRLTAILGNYDDRVRTGAVYLIISLAQKLNPKLAGNKDTSDKLSTVTLKLRIDEHEYHEAVQELFHVIAPSFSIMAIPLVAALEVFCTCLDASIRGICISALTRIVFENDRVFLEEDHLAAIWNLYFSLGSIAIISKVFPDRIVIVKGLGLLAPVYAAVDSSLTYGIIGTLLHLENKTILETEEIKKTVDKLFEKLPELDKKFPSNDIHAFGIGYNFFLNLLTPNDEFAYDLLPWAIQRYTQITYSSSKPENQEKLLPIPYFDKPFEPLDAFIKSLANHFRASPPLIRYGSSATLHTALSAYPRLIENQPELYMFILTGLLDTDHLSAFLYLATLELCCLNGSPSSPVQTKTLEFILKLRRQLEDDSVGYDTLYCDIEKPIFFNSNNNQFTVTKNVLKDIGIRDVLESASKMAPPIGSKLLHKLTNAFEYLSKRLKLRQLEIVRIWGTKSDKFDSHLMQAIFPLLQSIDEDLQLAAAGVIKTFIPKLYMSHTADINYAWTPLQTLMKPGTSAALLVVILGLIRDFPLDRLTDEMKEELLNNLLNVTFHPDSQVRYAAYDIIGSSSDYWRASSLWANALGILFLCLGDQSADCARKIIELILSQVEKVNGFKEIIIPLGLLQDSLAGSLVNTIKAYDQLANAILNEKSKLHDLVEALMIEANVDTFWYFYLNGVTGTFF